MTPPLHVVVNAVALAPGGGVTYLVNQAQALAEEFPTWRFTYFVDPSSHEVMRRAVPRSEIVAPWPSTPSLARRTWWEQRQLPRILKHLAPDVLYGIAGFAVFGTPVPQVLFNQNPNHHATRREIGLSVTLAISKLQRWAARRSVDRAATVIYGTHAYARAMQAVGFPAPDAVIASGVATDLPPSEPVVPQGGRPYVLAVHNWYRHKRLEWLVRTWLGEPRLAGRALTVVGHPVDRRTSAHLRRLVATIPSGREVTVIEGASRDEVAALYAGADLYLSASVLEAFPQTPFEAMAFGLPCVLSDIPPHREVAADAATYFTPGDEAGLVRAIACADRDREALVRRGRQRVGQFPWAENARRFGTCLAAAADPRQ